MTSASPSLSFGPTQKQSPSLKFIEQIDLIQTDLKEHLAEIHATVMTALLAKEPTKTEELTKKALAANFKARMLAANTISLLELSPHDSPLSLICSRVFEATSNLLDLEAQVRLFRTSSISDSEELNSFIQSFGSIESTLEAIEAKEAKHNFNFENTVALALSQTSKAPKENIKFEIISQDIAPIKTTLKNQTIISTAVTNLIRNAIDATNESLSKEDNPQPKTISISQNVTRKTLVICVQDQGVGIPEANLKHIFKEKFTTKNVSDKSTLGGQGRGLSLTKSSLEKIGAQISVYSTPDKGTSFSILVPLQNLANDELAL